MDAEKAMHGCQGSRACQGSHSVSSCFIKNYFLMKINTDAMDATLPRKSWQGVQVVARATLAVKNKILPWPPMTLP